MFTTSRHSRLRLEKIEFSLSAIWQLVDGNTQIFDMYGAHKGEKEMKNMEIIYTRKQ